jgi:cytochrome P450
VARGRRFSDPTGTGAPYWSAVTTVTWDGEGPAFLDLFSDGYDADPHGAHRAARRQAWYAETPMGRMALRHAEVSALLRDRRLAELGGRALAMVGITDGPLWDWWTTMLFSQDGESHQRLRRLVSTAFTPRSVEQSRPAVRAIAERLLAPLDPGAEIELVSAFCAPFAASVIGELLGIDRAGHGRFFAASDDLALASTGQLAIERDRIEAGLSALCDYAADLVADRRRRPGDDPLSRLVAAGDAGGRLTAGELVMLMTILIFGGLDTTGCRWPARRPPSASAPTHGGCWPSGRTWPAGAPRRSCGSSRQGPAPPGGRVRLRVRRRRVRRGRHRPAVDHGGQPGS